MEIKGIRDGLLVNLGDGEWDDVQESLLDHIDQQAEFLQDARIALDVGNHILKAVELSCLRDAISERGLTLWAVISNSPTTEKTAQTLGLATRLNKPRPERDIHTLDTTIQDGEQAVLVQRTLRSGYSLVFPGHVVIIGDVNPGAQVIAGGNVIVWGRMRGVVHAGAEGDEEAVVCALDLAPTQLRIAEKIAIPPKRRGKPQPEIASLKDDQVIAIQWNPKVSR
jgi:septum site-determining protein MinC